MGDPNFLHGTAPRSACAAFIKESRMEFANANKVYRKSSPTRVCENLKGTRKLWVWKSVPQRLKPSSTPHLRHG
jgi:hypothetical protein